MTGRNQSNYMINKTLRMEMNISEKLQSCRNCTNRKFDKTTDLVCGLTGNKPTFDAECPEYVADEAEIARHKDRQKRIEESERAETIEQCFLYGPLSVALAAAFSTLLKKFQDLLRRA